MKRFVPDEQKYQQLQQVCDKNVVRIGRMERARRVCAFLTLCAGLYALGGMVAGSVIHDTKAQAKAEGHTMAGFGALSATGLTCMCVASRKRQLRWDNRHIRSYLKYWSHLSPREKRNLYNDYVRQ